MTYGIENLEGDDGSVFGTIELTSEDGLRVEEKCPFHECLVCGAQWEDKGDE